MKRTQQPTQTTILHRCGHRDVAELGRSPRLQRATMANMVCGACHQALKKSETLRKENMKLFIYNNRTAKIVNKVIGGTQEQQMDYASEHYDADEYGWTYSPAFGMADGLIDTGEAIVTSLPA